MEWKYDKGDKVLLGVSGSGFVDVSDRPCRVVRRLTDQEADLDEVGPMYEVRLDAAIHVEGWTLDTYCAFEDELERV